MIKFIVLYDASVFVYSDIEQHSEYSDLVVFASMLSLEDAFAKLAKVYVEKLLKRN